MNCRHTIPAMFLFGCFVVPGTSTAAQDAEIVLHVHGERPLIPIQTTNGDEILAFEGEPIKVTIVATRLMSGADSESKTISEPLTDDVQIRYVRRTESGKESVRTLAKLESRQLKRHAPKSTASGLLYVEEVVASMPRLVRGQYEFQAVAGSVSSTKVLVTIMNGSESVEIERQYLRHKADAMPASPAFRFDEYKTLMLKLAKLEPENAMIFDQLGDASLNDVPLDETLAFYERSETLIVAQRKEAGSVTHPIGEQILDRKLAKHAEFKRILWDLQRRRSNEDVEVLKVGNRERFALVDRTSRTVVRMF